MYLFPNIFSDMTKKSNNLKAILKSLAELPEGTTIEGLKNSTGISTSEKTILRYVKDLVEQGKVIVEGKGRATRYFLQKTAEVVQRDYGDLPLSNKSKEIINYLSTPTENRPAQIYHTEFLSRYKPNVDYFLNDKQRARLAQIGSTPMPNQPAGTYAKEILHRLLIDLSWNSSRLEGNTYSLLDTERLLSAGQFANDKSALEAQMILNHKDAIEFLVQSGDEIGFNRYTITNLHAMLSNNLLPDPAASGRLRTFGVGIHQSTYIPLSIPQQIEEMFELMLKKVDSIKDPFEQTFFIMVHLPYLQPFDDVNKRVSRLAANISLNKKNLSPLSFIDVPNQMYIKGLLGIYEVNDVSLLRDVFVWAYERSAARYAIVRQTLGEPDPFRLKYRDAIKTLISSILRNALDKNQADSLIKEEAGELPPEHQAQFIESVETELLTLHEGNFARYWVAPSEFKRWVDVWKSE